MHLGTTTLVRHFI
jgi:DDE superfamily endonuclease